MLVIYITLSVGVVLSVFVMSLWVTQDFKLY